MEKKKCQSVKCENFTENEIEFNGTILSFCDECLQRMNINIANNIGSLCRWKPVGNEVDLEV